MLLRRVLFDGVGDDGDRMMNKRASIRTEPRFKGALVPNLSCMTARPQRGEGGRHAPIGWLTGGGASDASGDDVAGAYA